MKSSFRKFGLILRTARHLRLRQVFHRLLRRFRQPRIPRVPDATWSGERAGRLLSQLSALGPVDGRAQAEASAQAWRAGRLEWLGMSVPWEGDWRMQGPSPLWQYHLHYHEHLADVAWTLHRSPDPAVASLVIRELRSWSESWKSGGGPAWDAYPVAVRLVSWLRILAWTGPMLGGHDRDFIKVGIATHVAYLSRSLEWHIDGNHLLRDTCALALGAATLDGPWAERLRRKSISLFESTVAEQVLADGWHEERTPMYHVRALRDALEVRLCLLKAGVLLSPETVGRIDAMLEVLPWMQRGDGSLWQLNDTAGNHGVHLATLLAYRQGPTPDGVRAFESSRTVVLVASNGDRLRIDLGEPAPKHQPGHAHAGALGFEYDVAGIPLITDGGCSGYDGDPWRSYWRGTSSHSTVVLDGFNQSEMWAVFRVAARASVAAQKVAGDSRDFSVSAQVRPYHSRATEHRRVFSRRGRVVCITDEISGADERCVEGFFHFAPEWKIEAIDKRRFVLTHKLAQVVVDIEGEAEPTLHRAEYDPPIGWRSRGFNNVEPSWTLRLRENRYKGRPWRVTFSPS